MDDITKAALQDSIKIWEVKRDAINPYLISLSRHHCPLCLIHNTDNMTEDESCTGCPIYGATGSKWCNNSPFEAANAARGEWLDEKNIKRRKTCWVDAAQGEIDFLLSLLPKEEL